MNTSVNGFPVSTPDLWHRALSSEPLFSGDQALVVEDATERAQGIAVCVRFPRGFGRAAGLTPKPLGLVCNGFTGSALLAQAIACHATPQAVDLGQGESPRRPNLKQVAYIAVAGAPTSRACQCGGLTVAIPYFLPVVQ
ncbi:MAG: hypothetical protein NT102_03535 [Caldiserica bacterium]|nr:hypothetical protein [Caldisericota bacterium]